MTCLTNTVVMCPHLGTFPVPTLLPSDVGREEVKRAWNWKSIKELFRSPFSLHVSLVPNHVKMGFVEYFLVCLLVESVPVYRTALPEPN